MINFTYTKFIQSLRRAKISA